MDVNGSCHCGAVQFEARIDPKRVGVCHCTDCQIFSGSAFRTSVLVRGSDFKLLKGNPVGYEKTAESGSRRQLFFCGRCGTHLYGANPGAQDPIYSVRIGVLAQRAQLPPVVQVWCRSAVDWLPGLDEIRRVETQ